jgi:hypothetical protein
MEEEIGAYMIAIVVVISLRVVNSDEIVDWPIMNCSDVAEYVYNLILPEELDLIYVDAVALEHGIQLFKTQLRKFGRSESCCSILGLRWEVEQQRRAFAPPFGA